jgi:diguanylate cyclase (GGDEF)-like protein/PAS domain S-box-containing protein
MQAPRPDHDLHRGADLAGLHRRLRAAEERVFEAEAKYEALLEQLPAAIYTYSPRLDGPTYYMSPYVESLLGVPAAAFLESEEIWDELIHPDDRERSRIDYESYLRTGSPESGEYRYVRPDGRVVWVCDRSSTIRAEDGSPLYIQGVMLDITQTKEAELRMHHLAHHDHLTGLPNRAMFEEHLRVALARAKRLGSAVVVLFMDLDRFKPVNDLHGHDAGDVVLKQVAVRLRSAVRDADLVARQSGDEFLVLLTDIAPGIGGAQVDATLEAVVRRIAATLEQPFGLRGGEIRVHASIGWSVFPFESDDPRTLLRLADEAMYRRKRGTAPLPSIGATS